MKSSTDYFETDQQVAEHLGMSLPSFLSLRNDGRFNVVAKPRDPTPVFYREDIDRWIAEGRPVAGPGGPGANRGI